MVTQSPEILIGVRTSRKTMVERKMTATSLKIPATELWAKEEKSVRDRDKKGQKQERERTEWRRKFVEWGWGKRRKG
jgi:hypothetical protein